MKSYSTYKHSGIEWIGEIPEHWEMKKLKYLCELISEKSSDLPDFIIALENIESWSGNIIGDISHHDLQSEVNLFEKGDILFNKLRPYLAKVVETPRKGGSVGELLVLRPFTSIYSRFLFYRLISNLIISLVDGSTYGTKMPRASWENFISQLLIPVPSDKQEQTTIANYLDRKTAEIDTLIAQKKQLITLYKEERTATINQAVTKGLDPNAPMKPSGIEWLGDIPEHWEVKKVKHITQKIGSGVTPKGGSEIYLDKGIPLLRSQNVHNDGFRLNDVAFISDEIHQGMSGSKVFRGDVLLNITGGSIGRAFYVSDEFEEANVNQHVCIIRPNNYSIPEFLHAFLISKIGQLQIQFCQLGGNREAVNFEQIKNFYIPYPKIEEQKELMYLLSELTSEFSSQISNSEKEIELLQEYKTALISEVVLGKVDVREEVING